MRPPSPRSRSRWTAPWRAWAVEAEAAAGPSSYVFELRSEDHERHTYK